MLLEMRVGVGPHTPGRIGLRGDSTDERDAHERVRAGGQVDLMRRVAVICSTKNKTRAMYEDHATCGAWASIISLPRARDFT